jgi:peptidoglycan/LPS O-acetylase OafA/YrhL
VDAFFVMSGYLITTILLREHARAGRISLRRFYSRRALRLMPALVAVCLAVTVAFLLLPGITQRSETLVGTLGAVTYTSSVLAARGVDLGWMIPTWSLSVEEYFYFVWPSLVILAARRGARATRTMILSLATVAILYRLPVPALLDWDVQRIAYAADTRAEQLLIGGALAVLLPGVRRRIPAVVTIPACVPIALFVVLPVDVTFAFYYDHGGSTVVGLLSALLVAGVVRHPEGAFGRLLATPPFVWIGRRPYGIYLWNLPIVAVVATTTLGDAPQLLVKLALSFLIPPPRTARSSSRSCASRTGARAPGRGPAPHRPGRGRRPGRLRRQAVATVRLRSRATALGVGSAVPPTTSSSQASRNTPCSRTPLSAPGSRRQCSTTRAVRISPPAGARREPRTRWTTLWPAFAPAEATIRARFSGDGSA